MIRVLIAIIPALCFLSAGAQHFEPVWENPFNPMNVFILGAEVNNTDLMEGSEIGIFDTDPNSGALICVGSSTLTDEISPDDLFQVLCSMDDGTNPGMANGFTPGHSLQVKLYSPLFGEKGFCNLSFPYPGYDEEFTALGTAFAVIEYTDPCSETQTIVLPAGWSGISANLTMINTSLDLVLNPLLSEVLIFSDEESFFSTVYPNGSLAYWESQAGYYIKLNSPVTLELGGLCLVNDQIQVQAGWNLIPVLSEAEVNIEDAFAGHLQQIEIIREVAGFGVYWPEKQIFTLPSLIPGKSYQIKAYESFPLTF